jgi:hypothetical protein
MSTVHSRCSGLAISVLMRSTWSDGLIWRRRFLDDPDDVRNRFA